MALTICIIEDDDGIQDVLKIILERAGYQTEIFSDGKAIFEDRYAMPDLFLIDKQLSASEVVATAVYLDGLAICKHLKNGRNTKAIPVIMMSAYPNIREYSILACANDFIEKPFKVEALLATIRKHLHEEVSPKQVSA